MTRPSRYTENNSSRDWIDEFCATSTADEVRGAFRFTIGKYLRRYGKKDDALQEALKIQDYANRLVEFERASISKDFDQLTQSAGIIRKDAVVSEFEPAAAIDDESARAWVLGQNGEMAEKVYPAIDAAKDSNLHPMAQNAADRGWQYEIY